VSEDSAVSDTATCRAEYTGLGELEKAVYYGSAVLGIALGAYHTHLVLENGLPTIFLGVMTAIGGGLALISVMGLSVGKSNEMVAGVGGGVGLLLSPVVYFPLRLMVEMVPVLVEVLAS